MNQIEVDLHLHTNYSDVALSPRQIVQLCYDRGLRAIAITDHDTTYGLMEAKAHASKLGMKLINGIELGTQFMEDEVHILGYGGDFQDPGFQEKLSTFRNGRLIRGKKIVAKLSEIGLKVTWEQVETIAHDASVGRPHIAMALVQSGYSKNIKEAFTNYLNVDAPGFVPREMTTPIEAVKILKENGSVPVLAHPLLSNTKSGRKSIKNLDDLLPEICQAGLAGIEVFYGDYSSTQISYLSKIAEKYSLIKCGGSDYHNSENPYDPHPGDVGPPRQSLDQLYLAISRAS